MRAIQILLIMIGENEIENGTVYIGVISGEVQDDQQIIHTDQILGLFTLDETSEIVKMFNKHVGSHVREVLRNAVGEWTVLPQEPQDQLLVSQVEIVHTKGSKIVCKIKMN